MRPGYTFRLELIGTSPEKFLNLFGLDIFPQPGVRPAGLWRRNWSITVEVGLLLSFGLWGGRVLVAES